MTSSAGFVSLRPTRVIKLTSSEIWEIQQEMRKCQLEDTIENVDTLVKIGWRTYFSKCRILLFYCQLGKQMSRLCDH